MGNISINILKKIGRARSYIYALILLLLVLIILINIDYREILKIPNIIQLALFFGLAVYSLETFFLREITEKNLLFNQRPCMVPFIRHMNDGSYHLKIRNVGRGVALDISIKIIDPNGDYSGILNGNVKYMPTGDEKSIKFSGSKTDDVDAGRFDKTNLYNRPVGFKVMVICKDASNNPMTPFQYEIKPGKDANREIYTENIGLN